jgi:hypothetical protein
VGSPDRPEATRPPDCQISGQDARGWRESPRPASFFVKTAKAAGMVVKDAHVYQRLIKGKKTHQDTWLA